MPSASNFTSKVRVAAQARNTKIEYPGGVVSAVQPYISTVCSSTASIYDNIDYIELCDCKLKPKILEIIPAPAPAPGPAPAPAPAPISNWIVSQVLTGVPLPSFISNINSNLYLSNENGIQIFETSGTIINTLAIPSVSLLRIDSNNIIYYYSDSKIYKRYPNTDTFVIAAISNLVDLYIDSNGDIYTYIIVNEVNTRLIRLRYNSLQPNVYTRINITPTISGDIEIKNIVIDSSKNIYVLSNTKIYKVTYNSINNSYNRTTLFVLENAISLIYGTPTSLTISSTDIYISTTTTIYKLVNNRISIIAGSFDSGNSGNNGAGLDARFSNISKIHYYDGKIYIADTDNNKIRKLEYIV